VHSPFPAQVMSYPSPGPSMYPPPMTNGHNHMSHQPNGPPQGRGRGGLPIMSPVMSPASPTPHPNMMYSGSPVVMQPPPGMPGYPPPPGPMPGGRGQLRNGFDNVSMLAPSTAGPPQPPSTYAPMPSYVRPGW